MFQAGMEFVFEVTTPNRLPSSSSSRRISRLNHKTLDDPMENVAIVIAVLAVYAKVFDCFWALFAK
jgi:hypothetical protein